MSWQAAEQACEADKTATSSSTHLIVLDDQTEAQFAARELTYEWIGETDVVTEGAFVSVTSQQPYLPSTTNNDIYRNCAVLATLSGMLTTYIAMCASSAHPFLCECDGNPVVPSNF